MKPVRVLHILHSMNRGGAETMIMNYYRNINRDKLQFDFLLTVEGKSDYEDEILALGGQVFHVTPLTGKTIGKYCNDIKTFFKGHPEYRIIHSHTSSKSAFALGIGKKCGIPVRVSHSHNMLLTTRAFSPKEMLIKILRAPLKKVSTHNFACSKDAAIWLYGEEYWNEAKVKVLPNAIKTENFRFRNEVRKQYREQFELKDAFVVGHVGRFDEIKNHSFLLNIFDEITKKNENSRLLLVGDGILKENIEKKARQLGISEKIIFTGVRDDVPELMQAMDVFVFPSHFEGLGIVLVEAQTSGLPCFTSQDVVPQEVKMTNLLNFISLEETAEHWAEKILNYIELTDVRTGREQDIRNAGYEIKAAAKNLEEFYLTEYRNNCKEIS